MDTAVKHDSLAAIGMDKLVSRIPPPPRVPRVEGMSAFAPTVSKHPELDGNSQKPSPGRWSIPRWRTKQLARSRDIWQASGAIIAALLLGAIIAWASAR